MHSVDGQCDTIFPSSGVKPAQPARTSLLKPVLLFTSDQSDRVQDLLSRYRSAGSEVILTRPDWAGPSSRHLDPGSAVAIARWESEIAEFQFAEAVIDLNAVEPRHRFDLLAWLRLISALISVFRRSEGVAILRSKPARRPLQSWILALVLALSAYGLRRAFRLRRVNRMPMTQKTESEANQALLANVARRLSHRSTMRAGTRMLRAGSRFPMSRIERRAFGQSATGWMHGLPISRLAMHLVSVDPVRRHYPAHTRRAVRRLLVSHVQKHGGAQEDGLVTPQEAFAVNPTISTMRSLVASVCRWFDSQLSQRLSPSARRVAKAYDLIVNHAHDDRFDRCFGREILWYFRAPVGHAQHGLSRFEALTAQILSPTLSARSDADPHARTREIRRWFRHEVCARAPHLLRFSTDTSPVPAPWQRPRLEMTGFGRAESGLGRNLRMSQRAFAAMGLLPQLRDVENNLEQFSAPTGPVLSTTAPATLNRTVAVHHVNADGIPQVMMSQNYRRRDDIHHIGFLLWEFDVLPETHRLALDLLDEIWVPSLYLKSIYEKATDTPVHWVGKAVDPGRARAMDLTEFGLRRDCFTFLVAFDAHSSTERKNPLAAVNAFLAAFPQSTSPDVQLLIKSTPVADDHWGDPHRQMQAIRRIARSDHRVRVIESILDDDAFIGLIACCDCVVSPHRTEGFGYIPAFALRTGRAVIATDYAAPQEFCTEDTSFPVKCHMKAVARDESIFPVPGAFWAEIDQEHLATRMQEVVANPDIVAARTRAGRTLMEETYSPAAQTARYHARLNEAGLVTPGTLMDRGWPPQTLGVQDIRA